MPTSAGTLVDEVVIDVECGKIREFVRACAVADPVHTDSVAAHEAGFPDVLATANHVVVVGHQRDQQAFVTALGLDITRVVVGSVGWTYERPLVAGDRLRATRRVVSDVTKANSMRLVTLETTFLDTNEQVAVRQREVLIERPR
jgi:acyl dehydratase